MVSEVLVLYQVGPKTQKRVLQEHIQADSAPVPALWSKVNLEIPP